MSPRPLRALPDKRPRGLAELIRPDFCVDRYLPPRDNPYLYGQHCSVDGCDRPGNDLIVESRRLCQRHAYRFKRAPGSVEEFLAAAPLVAARSELTGLPRYDLTATSAVTRDELRFLLQSIHDGVFALTFSSKRWNALRAIYAGNPAASLVDIDLAAQPAARVATASGKRFQRFLRDTHDRLAGVQPSRHDDVWPQALYECFVKPMQGRPPGTMDFTTIQLPWLREAAKDVAWQRMGLEGIAPQTAWDMVRDVMRFEGWAGARLRDPYDITRSLLVDWLIHNRATLAPRSLSQGLSRLRLFLDHARVAGLAISSDATYLAGELAIRGELDSPPKYFDDGELAQLDAPANLKRLSDYNRRAYLVYADLRIMPTRAAATNLLPAQESFDASAGRHNQEPVAQATSWSLAGSLAGWRRSRPPWPRSGPASRLLIVGAAQRNLFPSGPWIMPTSMRRSPHQHRTSDPVSA